MTAYLADTNIIVQWVLPHDPLCPAATASVKLLLHQGHSVYVGVQNLIEFWSVATRPSSANGLGMSPVQAARELDRIEALFPLLEDSPAIYREWRQLAETCEVSGREAYDARLAALVLVRGVTHILTFNVEDFRRHPGIVVVNPNDMRATPAQP